jgi:enamine deaminase RidA (YjgF/YER057c/UK114 family)
MSKLKYISSGAPWESTFGYSRAVRYGNTIEFSGTVCPQLVPGGEYEQTKSILETIEKYLLAEGGHKRHIVRTRVFCMHIDRWQEIARAHSEFFEEHRPATSLIQVSGLIDPKYMIEIEATAVLDEEDYID